MFDLTLLCHKIIMSVNVAEKKVIKKIAMILLCKILRASTGHGRLWSCAAKKKKSIYIDIYFNAKQPL